MMRPSFIPSMHPPPLTAHPIHTLDLHPQYWGPMGEGPLADTRNYPPEQRWDTLASDLGNTVLDKCPRWVIFAEGVGHCMVDSQVGCPSPSSVGQDVRVATWWGENLQGALRYPIKLKLPNKLVLSPHVYGPSVSNQPYFTEKGFPDNLPAIWRLQWGHIPLRSGTPVVLGEWGGRYEGADKVWQEKLAGFLADPANKIAGSFYWSLNPESRDTGGILEAWSKDAGQPDGRKLALLRRIPATHILTRAERRDGLAPMPPSPPHPNMPPHPPIPPSPHPPPPSPPPPPLPHPPYGAEAGAGWDGSRSAWVGTLKSADELRAERSGDYIGGGEGDELDAGGAGREPGLDGGAGGGAGGRGSTFLRRLSGGMALGLLLLASAKAWGSSLDLVILDRINAFYGRRYGREVESAVDYDELSFVSPKACGDGLSPRKVVVTAAANAHLEEAHAAATAPASEKEVVVLSRCSMMDSIKPPAPTNRSLSQPWAKPPLAQHSGVHPDSKKKASTCRRCYDFD